MKKKKIFWGFGIFVLFIIMCYFINGNANPMNQIDSKTSKVSFQTVSNSFYYDQLDAKEKAVCDQVKNMADEYKGGEILLEEAISTYNLIRVVRTLCYDDTHSRWWFVSCYPFDKENKLVNRNELNLEDVITKLYVQINEKEERQELKDFEVQYSAEGILENGEEFAHLLEYTSQNQEYITEKKQEIEKIEAEIIAQMPKDITPKEAVNYFCIWLKNNMSYAYAITPEQTESGIATDNLYEQNLYSNTAYEHCVIKKEAVCSGFSIILSKLCNQVGIHAYVVVGTMTVDGIEIPHAWVAVEIDGNTYYTDPTYVVEMNRLDGFRMKHEMLKERWDGRKYAFEQTFEW